MAKSAYQLFKEGTDPSQIGNPQLRQELMAMQRQNYQAQLAQVNANYQAGLDKGLTPAEAATTWVGGKPGNKYTVKDGDSLPKIAEATGASEADILAANPDMDRPEAGMILNTGSPYFQSEKFGSPVAAPPLPGSEAWRVQQQSNGGLGLPSNGNFGAQGQPFGRFAEATNAQLQVYGQALGAAQNRPAAPSPTQGGPHQFDFASSPINKALTALTGANGPARPPGPHQFDYANSPANRALTALTGGNTQTTPQNAGGMAPPGPAAKKTVSAPRGNVVTLLDNITSQVGPEGRIPTDFELKMLVDHARVKPAQQQTAASYDSSYYSGGYRRYGRGGYGGRGGGGGYSQYSTKNNRPAFSSSGGFRGLVNWRI